MRILHIGTEKNWRGGENQIRFLVEGLKKKTNVNCFIAYPKGSRGLEEFSRITETLSLSSSIPIDPISIIKLVYFCKKNRIELIDAHSSGAHSLALIVKKILPQLKIVVHRRVDNVPTKSYFTKKKYFSPSVDRFVCISNFIREVLIAYGVTESKIRVALSAVSAENYNKINRDHARRSLRELINISSETTLIGNASAFTEQKGYDVLLRAIAELKKERVSFHVALAGDGPLLEPMKALARELEITQLVTFLGHISKVPEFLSGLDILAVPSNNEGLGTIILDGILAGLPVTASKVGGIPEMIKDKMTGLLFNKGDHQALAKNLLKLIRDANMRQVLNQNARMFIIENFSIEAMVEGNYRVYKELLPNP